MIRVKKRQIFVVEDDEAVRASTRALLEAQGFLVRDFVNAEAFLLATDGRDGDCIVLDHNLLGMSGLDLIALLRARGVTTPAIIVSGQVRSCWIARPKRAFICAAQTARGRCVAHLVGRNLLG